MILFSFLKKVGFFIFECTLSHFLILHRFKKIWLCNISFVVKTFFLFLWKIKTPQNSYNINKSQYLVSNSDNILHIKITNYKWNNILLWLSHLILNSFLKFIFFFLLISMIIFSSIICLFVCLFVCFVCLFVCLGFSSHSRIFHSYGNVTFTGEGLQILTYARHSWSLSSEGSLACHTYFDTGHPFMMVISEDPWHLHVLPSVLHWSCHYLFLRLRSGAARIRTPNLPTAIRTI